MIHQADELHSAHWFHHFKAQWQSDPQDSFGCRPVGSKRRLFLNERVCPGCCEPTAAPWALLKQQPLLDAPSIQLACKCYHIQRCWAHSGTSLCRTPALSLSLSLSQCDTVQMWWHFLSAGSFRYSFPAFWDEGKSTSACPFSTTKLTNIYSFLVFSSLFFPTQDHLSMCHPRNKTQGQTQRTAWIIACPQLQKHGIQLFSSYLHNRARNTERSRKVLHLLFWVMTRQFIVVHQCQLTSPNKSFSNSKM